MNALLKLLLARLADRKGQVRGWRIPLVTTVIGALFTLLAGIKMEWSQEWQDMLPVVLATFTGGGFLIALVMLARNRLRPAATAASRTTPPNRRSLYFCLLGTAILIIFAAGIVPQIWTHWASLAWPSTQARIRTLDLEGSSSRPNPIATVMFQADGHPVLAKVDANGLGPLRAADARRVQQRLAPGTTHTLWYDPGAPTNAVLSRGPGLKTIAVCISGPAFGLGFIALGARRLLRAIPDTHASDPIQATPINARKAA